MDYKNLRKIFSNALLLIDDCDKVFQGLKSNNVLSNSDLALMGYDLAYLRKSIERCGKDIIEDDKDDYNKITLRRLTDDIDWMIHFKNKYTKLYEDDKTKRFERIVQETLETVDDLERFYGSNLKRYIVEELRNGKSKMTAIEIAIRRCMLESK